MATRSPTPLTATQLRTRRNRIARLTERLGFIGRIEYRHEYSKTGGANYRQDVTTDQDLLTVYVEAFEWDANPDEFSLNAILAHECGHQLLVRHPRLAPKVAGLLSAISEEILASVLGAIICKNEADAHALMGKAIVEAVYQGVHPDRVVQQLDELKGLLEAFL